MKCITLSQVGYSQSSQANWAYRLWKIDFIDTSQSYCNSIVVREVFGGDTRFKESIKEAKINIKVIETKRFYTSTGNPKITGISKLIDIESKELLQMVKEFKTNN